ncbi:hypothetical protein MYOV065v1_p0002 [Vibrio phage PS15B.2]|nr:hypothetical protein MYOV065v1_p0002 [Vibrio phage PS15B.2]QZI90785.1 hypothetical protein MYOV066v1_p0007 [Vibrio phage PS15B.3]QZI90852.1 hypothetical protein MYOV064v1_p0002 [Vibrio phage PS15B.4]
MDIATEKAIEIVNDLISALDKHDAKLTYTTDDNGVHVQINGETIAIIEPNSVTYP